MKLSIGTLLLKKDRFTARLLVGANFLLVQSFRPHKLSSTHKAQKIVLTDEVKNFVVVVKLYHNEYFIFNGESASIAFLSSVNNSVSKVIILYVYV